MENLFYDNEKLKEESEKSSNYFLLLKYIIIKKNLIKN